MANLTRMLLGVLPVVLLIGFSAGSLCAQQDDKYKVGDEVRFELLDYEYVGEILDLNAAGWYQIEFKSKTGQQVSMIPPARVLSLVKRRRGSGSESHQALAPASAWHTWRDKSGQYTLRARFVQLNDNTLTLQKEDGGQVVVQIDRLLEEDARRARLMGGSIAAGDTAASPFRDVAAQPAVNGPEVVTFDFSDMITRDATVGGSDWRLRPARLPQIHPADCWQRVHVDMTQTTGAVTDPRMPDLVYVGYRDSRRGLDAGFLINTQSSSTVGPICFPAGSRKVLSLDGASGRLLTVADPANTSGPGTVELWRVDPTDGHVQRELGLVPDDGSRRQPNIHAAAFLDQDRIVLVKPGLAAIFNLNQRVAESVILFDRDTIPVISPDRSYLFGSGNGQLVAFELEAAEVAGRCRMDLAGDRCLAINSLQTRAASLQGKRITIWDLIQDQLIDQFIAPTMAGDQISFVDDEHLLVQGDRTAWLVNIPLRSVIWRYLQMDLAPTNEPGRFWVTAGKPNDFAAGQLKLPHAAVQEVTRRLNQEDLVELRPGQSVQTSLKAAGPGQNQIRRQLEERGYRVASNAEYELRAKVDEESARPADDPADTDDRDEAPPDRPQSFELALYRDGQKVWFSRGRSVGAATSDAVFASPAEFFQTVQIPELFVRTPVRGQYGSSEGSATGLKDRFR